MSPAVPADPERSELGWLALATGIAAILRFYRLGANSLWIDELATLLTARFPLGAIPGAALQGDAFEPPLYFWLIHLVIDLWGESELVLRLPSAIAGVLTIPVVWRLMREVGAGRRAADLCALLVAVHPLHLWYSQEARPYALMIWAGLLSLLSLAMALRGGMPRHWVGYAVFGAIALITHATGVVFPAIGFLWVLLSERPRRSILPYVAASLLMLVAIAPVLVLLGQAVVGAESTGSPPRPITGLEIPYTLFTYVAGYSLGPAVRDIQDLGWAAAIRVQPVQTAVGVGVLAAAVLLAGRLRSRAAAFLAVLLAVPLAATFAGAVITSKAYNVRYTVPAAVGFVGLVSLAVSGLRPSQIKAAAGLLVAVFLWADAQWFLGSRFWKEDSRAAVACLRRTLPDGALVGIAPGYMASVVGHYAEQQEARFQVRGVKAAEDLSRGPLPDALLLTRRHHVPDPEGLVTRFRAAAPQTASSAEIPGFRIHFRGPDAEAAARICGGDQ